MGYPQVSTLPQDIGQMAQWQWGLPSDPTDDGGPLDPSHFAGRELAALRPVDPLSDSQGDDNTEIALVQEDGIDAEQSASSRYDLAGSNIDLESRLSDHRSLAPDIDSSLPGHYSRYDKAVLTGFAPFNYRSYNKYFDKAHAAMQELNPGVGSTQIELMEGVERTRDKEGTLMYYQTDISYHKEDNSGKPTDDSGISRTIQVIDFAQPYASLYSYTTSRATADDSFRRELTVDHPQYGKYDMTSTRDELTVKYESFSNPSENGFEFKYRPADRFIEMSGHIPAWQGQPGSSHP